MNPDERDKPVSSKKDLAKIATGSLSDEEVYEVGQVVGQLVEKYAFLPATENNLARLDDEATDRLYRLGYLVHLDVEPCLSGQPPIIDIMGKVGDVGFQKPFDHERGIWGVNKAHSRGEYHYGELERTNPVSKSAKKRKLILPDDPAV